jgi:hypothetical protein
VVRRLCSWVLRRFFGYVRLSDYVTVEVKLSKPACGAPNFNPDLIIGPANGERKVCDDDQIRRT